MKSFGPFAAGLALMAALSFTPTASAQLPWRWFGSKTSDKNLPTKGPFADPRREVEVNVEVAWLADPVTFPYYLEAHFNGTQQLEVRGYVPNKTVREHALRTAQVYSSMPVTDLMKEHPSLLVRSSPMSAEQLKNSVVSSLKAALPKQYQQLKVDCDPEGKVFVAGTVGSFEEKIAVSHSLRRLHGCTSVQNMTAVPAELAQQNAGPPSIKASAEPLVKAPDIKSRLRWPWSINKETTKPEVAAADPPKKLETKTPTLVDVSARSNSAEAPILIPPMILTKAKTSGQDAPGNVEVASVEAPVTAAKTPLNPRELQKRIQEACPKVVNVEVTFTSASSLRIVMSIRSSDDINAVAESIFAMPELQNYNPDLQFKVGS